MTGSAAPARPPRSSTSPRWWPSDEQLPAARGGGRARPGRISRARRPAVLAEIDALARAPQAPPRRPTPRRCSGCACSTTSSSRSWASPATSTTTTTPTTATCTRCCARGAASRSRWRVLYIELASADRPARARRVASRATSWSRCTLPQGEVVIDPVHRPVAVARRTRRAARALQAPQRPASATSTCRSACSCRRRTPREIIARMLRNLKEIHRSAEDWPRLLACSTGWSSCCPTPGTSGATAAWRRPQLGAVKAAVADLSSYLEHAPRRARPLRHHASGLARARPRRPVARCIDCRLPLPGIQRAASMRLTPAATAHPQLVALAARRGCVPALAARRRC